MKALMIAALAGGLVAPGLIATPALAQNSSPQQMLQGLLTGNQNQDRAVRDAYERGYRAGRQDEARMNANNSGNRPYDNANRGYSRNDNRAYSGNDNNGYNGNRTPYDRNGMNGNNQPGYNQGPR
ncbi:MAG TPA: hypothetical protein VHO91_17155 [Rhodopila sp.]|nr:hypothetical protein [Rhodopila sp.]